MTTDTKAVLQRAAERARELDLPYAGAVTPAEAWQLHQAGAATIIDVRTEPEWLYVGHIPGTQRVEWRLFKAKDPNPDFVTQLGQLVKPDQPVLFLCRSAQRSHQAAILVAKHGYAQAFNILEGFEGEIDANEQRGLKNGWRKTGLPWVQS